MSAQKRTSVAFPFFVSFCFCSRSKNKSINATPIAAAIATPSYMLLLLLYMLCYSFIEILVIPELKRQSQLKKGCLLFLTQRKEILAPLMVPEDVVFRPRKKDVEQLKQRDFLGKAKV